MSDPGPDSPAAMEILPGCWQETRRVDMIAGGLLHIRELLHPEFYNAIGALWTVVESTGFRLRDLSDLFPIYTDRVSLIRYYLHIVLPCLQKTLEDMKVYVGNTDMDTRVQWCMLRERLDDEGGLLLTERFELYEGFLVQLIWHLSRYVITRALGGGN